MVNPYFCYSFAFLASLVSYALGWSDLYPKLSFTLLLIILLTIVVHVSIGIFMTKRFKVSFYSLRSSKPNAPIIVTSFIYFLWLLEFFYEGGIPLFKILLNQPFNYRLFGIPSLHVFIVTFSSFYTIYIFHLFLSSRKKAHLVLYGINLFAAILIYNRGMFLFNLSATLFLFLLSLPKIPKSAFYILPIAAIILLYFFGVLGTLRVSRESKEHYNNNNFLGTGRANQKFLDSGIPREFFWSYIYISSPLANLQSNINSKPDRPISFSKTFEMINNEIVMDFISKRVNGVMKLEREKEKTIEGPFNVSTVYSGSYSYLGWFGMILMLLILIAIPIFYQRIVPAHSTFFLSGFAILCSLFLFSAFDNTIRFTGLSFPMVYPIVFTWLVPRSKFIRDLFC